MFAAIADGQERRAARRLVNGYLPALEGLAAGMDPERIEDALDVLERRMTVGLTMTDDPPCRGGDGRLRVVYVHQGDDADDLFAELLEEYETLFDVASLRHVGTRHHPAAYLTDRIAACR